MNWLLNKSWEFWFEWSITALLILGVVLTSLNIFPLNLYVLLVSNIGWVVQAVLWKKTSLFIVQLVITIIYVFGIIKVYI